MRLLYTIPMSNATAERSFSTMKKLKSATRSLSGQERLNSLMLLSIHRSILKTIVPKDVIHSFIFGKDGRAARITIPK